MARGYSQSRSESGPYGGADYRAAEAKRGGGNTGATMKSIRAELNASDNREVGEVVDRAVNIRKITTGKSGVLDKFNMDIGDVQFNPYRPFTNFVDKDVDRESLDKLNTFVAFRDFLKEDGGSKQEIARLDEAIEDYADKAEDLRVFVNNSEDGDKPGSKFQKILAEYNKSALSAKNLFQDIILPSKKGPRNI